jgi:hypothetical protein
MDVAYQPFVEKRRGHGQVAGKKKVPDTAVVERSQETGWITRPTLQVENAGTVAAGHGLRDTAVLVQHRIRVQAKRLSVLCLIGQWRNALIGDHVRPRHDRASSGERYEPRAKHDARFIGQNANLNVDARRTQSSRAALAPRCRIDHRKHYPTDLGVYQRLSTRGRSSLVVAGLQGDHRRRPHRQWPRRR